MFPLVFNVSRGAPGDSLGSQRRPREAGRSGARVARHQIPLSILCTMLRGGGETPRPSDAPSSFECVKFRSDILVFGPVCCRTPQACHFFQDSIYCAAGAISKECKRVSVPEVLFKQLLKRIDRTDSDPLFWATCGHRAVFEVENRGSRGSDRAQILSVVCLCQKITEHFWTRSIELRSQVREKIVEKRGSRPSLSAEIDHFWDPIGSVRNSLVCCLRLRRNLPRGFILVITTTELDVNNRLLK